MIRKICLLQILSVAWASGASYSNVYVRTGSDVAPKVKYVEYGAPNPQLGQLRSAPVDTVYPVAGYETPCIPSPCLYKERTRATVASATPSANIVAFQPSASNLPVVVPPNANDQPVYSPGYEYGYSIYNQLTGDQKLHNEFSNSGVVRGEYAFLQPDGLIREVQYVANDAKGFNAVVKNFLPAENPKLLPAQPCPDFKKSEPLIEEAEKIVGQTEDLSITEAPVAETLVTQDVSITQAPALILTSTEDNSLSLLDQYRPSKDQSANTVFNGIEDIIKGSQQQPDSVTSVTQQVVPQAFDQFITVNQDSNGDLYVPYNLIMKCIQAALKKINDQPSVPKPQSPLTYLIFNKPC